MTNDQDKINQLFNKLDTLLQRQEAVSQEVDQLRQEIERLKVSGPRNTGEDSEKDLPDQATELARKEERIVADFLESTEKSAREESLKPPVIEPPEYSAPKVQRPPSVKSDLEKFIGENLINKIGIAITVIGVAIGAKYAIDHELISPLTRIILGYMVGLGLLGFAIRLKKPYENFSAVLLSGSMAIMYFITYASYSYYALLPQAFAFVLMVVFTVFTVAAAVHYKRQVIAHIGLVGAYAVPLLLSDGSGKIQVLFSYTAIINVGILAIASKKYWKPLYFSSFFITWLIYFLWFVPLYQQEEHFALAFSFLFIFFAIFYLTFLVSKLLQDEFKTDDLLVLLVVDAFIFYGTGYFMLADHDTGKQLLGLFTLFNALVHFIASVVVYRRKLADRNLFYFISGLVLIFITIAVPVQLDGNWVTLLWAGEAALLFWIGRTKGVAIYEKLSYPLMVLAFFSLTHDWTVGYSTYRPGQPETRITPWLNINFLSSLLFLTSFGFIQILDRKEKYLSPLSNRKKLSKVITFCISAVFLFTLYCTFQLEISTYWDQLYSDSSLAIDEEGQTYPSYYRNDDLLRFKSIWIINYSLLFLTLLAAANFKKLKSPQWGYINLLLNVLALTTFLIQGLYLLGELRDSYLMQTLSLYHKRGIFNILIRYVSFAFVSVLLISCYLYTRQEFIKRELKMPFDILLHTTILWVASSELIHWIDLGAATQSDKLGLSILWGIYALLLIVLGIWKKRKYLRIGAIVLFTVTLLKLFLYDIVHMDTIAKTIVFVSLGILLLIISFLYNKYKQVIIDGSES